MSTDSKVILVTGGNRSIGYEICKGILQYPSGGPYTVIVGSRNPDNGAEAIKSLTPFAKNGSIVTTAPIEVTSDSSISSAAKEVEEQHGKLDVLILNAAIARIPKDIADLRKAYHEILDANVASVDVCIQYFLPLLRNASTVNPRLIVVSSSRGSLERNSDPSGYPTRSMPYSVSKAAVNLQVVNYGKDLRGHDGNKGVKVWATCPGHCKTAFNNFQGPKDPADGAKSTVELACCGEEQAGKYEVGRMWEFEGGMRIVPY